MESFLMNDLSTIAGMFLVATYIPQLVKTYKTKSVDGVSILFWIALNITLGMLLVSSIATYIYKGVYGYMIVEVLNVSLSFAMLCLVIKYRGRK